MKRIQSLPHSLRPREKLLTRGPEALTTAELFSVILITGTKQQSVLSLGSKVARLIGKGPLATEGLSGLKIGKSKTAQVLAVLEISRRLKEPKPTLLTSPSDIFAQSFDILHEKKEMLVCFYINARGELLKKETVVVGSLNRANVLPREIFNLVQELPVASIILVHNHPSGVLEPSKDDVLFTKRVKKAGDILGITLLDHLIVTPKGWVQIKL